MRCGSPHPADAERTCLKQGRHGHHNDGQGSADSTWPNPDFIPRVTKKSKAPSKRATMSAMSEFLKTEAAPPDSPPIETPNVRSGDPETSHEAAERYEPKRGTAQARVLEYLRARPNEWIDAPALTTPEVGGFAGTRRLRELREGGWDIETRPKPGAINLWQHRLVD